MKSLSSSLQYFVVQKGRLSNKDAIQAILTGRVLVNGQKGQLQQALKPEDQVVLDGKVLKEPQKFLYLAYYKPRGIESTLSLNIENNLAQALGMQERVFPIGRLDKESEGLMLLTNDGTLYHRIANADQHQEKEYVVTVDKPLTQEALDQVGSGIVIMGQKTRPAQVQQVGQKTFSIVLTQGLNRQIRRMCYKLAYEVERLVRVRIVNVEVGDLKPGEWRELEPAEKTSLTKRLMLFKNSG
ncbi:pseudouridine synthase [Nibribacter ruber]|nr:pseudouridine synthase [Nibribacter ruber]